MGVLTDLVTNKVEDQNKQLATELATYATVLQNPQASEQVHQHALTKVLGMAGVKGKEVANLAPALTKLLRHLHGQDGGQQPQGSQAPPQGEAASMNAEAGTPAPAGLPAALPATPAGPDGSALPQPPPYEGHHPGFWRRTGNVLRDIGAGAAAGMSGSPMPDRFAQKQLTSRLAYIDSRQDLTPQQREALKMQAMSGSAVPIENLGQGAQLQAKIAAEQAALEAKINAIRNDTTLSPEQKQQAIEEAYTGMSAMPRSAGTDRPIGTPVQGSRFPGVKTDAYGAPIDPNGYYMPVDAGANQPPKLYPAMPATPKYSAGTLGLIEIANDPHATPEQRAEAKKQLQALRDATAALTWQRNAAGDLSSAREDWGPTAGRGRGGRGAQLREGDINRLAASLVSQVNTGGQDVSYDQKLDWAIRNLTARDEQGNFKYYAGDPLVDPNREVVLKQLYALKAKRPTAAEEKAQAIGKLIRKPGSKQSARTPKTTAAAAPAAPAPGGQMFRNKKTGKIEGPYYKHRDGQFYTWPETT